MSTVCEWYFEHRVREIVTEQYSVEYVQKNQTIKYDKTNNEQDKRTII